MYHVGLIVNLWMEFGATKLCLDKPRTKLSRKTTSRDSYTTNIMLSCEVEANPTATVSIFLDVDTRYLCIPKELWQIFRRKRFNALSCNSYKLQETHTGVSVNFKEIQEICKFLKGLLVFSWCINVRYVLIWS